MGVDIPQPFDTSVSGSLDAVVSGSLGAIGPVTIDGIPSTYHINIDSLPKIQLGVDPITLNPVTADVNIRIKEFPSIRGHLPADFSIGLSLLGIELLCVRICGEAQVITEPYRPNPCEICEEKVLPVVPVTGVGNPSRG